MRAPAGGTLVIAFFATVAVAGIGTAFVMEWGPFGSALTRACEELLAQRLRSPSAYQRVSVDSYERSVPMAEYRAILLKGVRGSNDATARFTREQIERDLTRMETEGRLATRFLQYIRYDAPNAYGTMIRGLSECEYVSATGTLSGVSEHSVRVDGLTSTEHLIERIKAARQ